MKKIKFLIVTIIGISLCFSSCNVNSDKIPEFNDKDASVAFTIQSYSVEEDYSLKNNGKYFQIPVTLASLNGISSQVKFEIIDVTLDGGTDFERTSKEGINYNLISSNTLNFDAANRKQYIEIEIINIPDDFTRDFEFYIQITNGGSVKIGSDSICTVRILDMDHPLANILGDYNGVGNSYFDGRWEFTPTFEKDEEDVSLVWIRSFFYGQNQPIYGVVNSEMTEIRIPHGQTLTMSAGEPYAVMAGWFVEYDEDGNEIELEDDEIPDGHNLILYIEDDNGQITITMPPIYWLGSYVIPSDAWFEIYIPWPVPGGGQFDHDWSRPMITLIKL